jgi:hypothetical protein
MVQQFLFSPDLQKMWVINPFWIFFILGLFSNDPQMRNELRDANLPCYVFIEWMGDEDASVVPLCPSIKKPKLIIEKDPPSPGWKN